MATVILLRHGRTEANASGTLAGRTAGVHLDDLGRTQATRAGDRLAVVPLAELVSSPLERCKETARVVAARQARHDSVRPRVHSDKGLTECDYGEWQGRKLRELARSALWKTVQTNPSAATFPGGESLPQMQARAVDAVRRRDAAVGSAHGSDAVWLAVSHGDVIKSVIADALGMHLDLFQRIQVDPASISVIRYTDARPYVLATNSHEGDLSWLAPKHRRKRTRSRADQDAPVGGGAGPGTPA
ncbi:MAG TPA: MSMEG_4193 family putative phosphomutase [Nocardioides sp.]|uniref:MSMEG_4193 family putative phosphomutase n=1 Tax=Nocardioides sp. TaxID=35761 RepID=UPI002F407987